MSLEEKIAANTAAIEKLTALLANPQVVVTDQPVKLQPAAAGAGAEKAAKPAKAKAEPKPEPVEAKPAVTYAEAATALKALANVRGRDEVMALLAKYDAKKTLQEVKPERFADLVADAEKALA